LIIQIEDKRKNIPHYHGKCKISFYLAKNFKIPPPYMNPPMMMRGRGYFGRSPRGGRGGFGRGGRGGFSRGGFKPY
jgi:hypothetical protein